MAEKVYKNRVKEKYEKEVVPFLMKKFGYTSVMQCPKLVKIVINTGLGDIKDNAKSMQTTENEIKLISAQGIWECWNMVSTITNWKTR